MTRKKPYAHRLYILGDGEWKVRVHREADGTFTWRQDVCVFGSNLKMHQDYTPTAADWAALALKISEDADNERQACEDTLEAIQDEPDTAKKLAIAIEYFAEGCEARQCDDCKRWTTEGLTEIGLGRHTEHVCDNCLGNIEPACRGCGGRGCMSCIGVPSSGPIP